MADRLAAEADFLSVGTNDLTQYTLAVDRGNARLAERFTPHDPSVLRLLKMVADAARTAGKPASVGGEMASERSEERRVGEEGRSRWSPDHLKKKKENTGGLWIA